MILKKPKKVLKRRNVFTTLGASNHTDKVRQGDDFYATEPIAADILHNEEDFKGGIWECACGEGHLSKRFIELGHEVISTDLIYRGYGHHKSVDFLNQIKALAPNIVTNPPYKHAQEFIEKALSLVPEGGKVAMFLKLTFLEGKKRKDMFTKFPPKVLYVSSSRIQCAKNADFVGMKKGGGSAVAYGWYVWEKGIKRDTIIKWVN